jgi:transglutaminase-like putative cysteine protease
MFKSKIIIFLIFFLFIFPTSYSQEIEISISEEALDFSAIKSKYIDVNFLIEIPITITEYNEGDNFIFKTPIFSDNQKTQKVNVEAYYLEDNEKIFADISEDQFGNKIAVFNIRPITKFQYVFYLEGNIISENKIVFSNEVFDLKNKITEFEEYRKSTKYIKSDNLEIITLANTLKYSDNALEQITYLTNWVHQYLEYDLIYADSVEDSIKVLSERKGVCDEFSIFLGALLRAQGFPVKYVTGIANTSYYWENHAWLEVYVPNQGWIPIDPTYNEVGLVDSSHIIISKVSDPSESQDIITASNSVYVVFNERNEIYRINDKKNFTELGYANVISIIPEYYDKINSESGINIKFTLKNTTVKPLAILFNLEHHEDFKLLYPNSPKQIVYFDEFESKEINFYFIAPTIPENSHGYIYPFRLSSQINDFELQITVSNSNFFYQDIFFVTDPIFYFANNKIIMETELINKTDLEKQIDFKYDYNGNVFEKKIVIAPNESKTYKEEIELIDRNKSSISFLATGDFEYSKLITIYPDKIIKEEVDQNITNQNVNSDVVNDENIEFWKDSEEYKITEPTKFNKNILFVFLIFLVLGIVGYLVTGLKKVKPY